MNDELTLDQKKLDASLRIEAVRIATQYGESADDIVKHAKKIYKFLKGS